MVNDVGPTDDWPLGLARAWLRDRVEDGARCPCCTQFAKVYYRKVNASMVRGLVAIYGQRNHDDGFAHLPTLGLGHLGGEAARMSYWNLVEEEPVVREDGGRAGWWRITVLGVDWLHSRTAVPTYARIYDGRLLALTGEPCWVADAVREKFDLTELMRGI